MVFENGRAPSVRGQGDTQGNPQPKKDPNYVSGYMSDVFGCSCGFKLDGLHSHPTLPILVLHVTTLLMIGRETAAGAQQGYRVPYRERGTSFMEQTVLPSKPNVKTDTAVTLPLGPHLVIYSIKTSSPLLAANKTCGSQAPC